MTIDDFLKKHPDVLIIDLDYPGYKSRFFYDGFEPILGEFTWIRSLEVISWQYINNEHVVIKTKEYVH